MARIRTIKPEFFTSEDIVRMSPLARLFYVSLWCEADREGRFEWKPGTFKLRYLPGDECSVDVLASELIDAGLVVLYEVSGTTYAEIPSFKKHQVINNRESESTLPPRVRTRESGVQTCARGREGRKGKEGDSTEPPSDSSPALPQPPIVAIPLVDKTEFPVTQIMVEEWQEAYPAVNVVQELREMRAWSFANPTNRKTAKGVQAFVNRWLGKEQDKGRGQPGPKSGGVLAGAI